MIHEVPASMERTNESRLYTQNPRGAFASCQTFELTFLPLLIHLSSTPHPFQTLLVGQWSSKGPKEIKIRVTKTLLPKCLGRDPRVGAALQTGAKNTTKESKPHLLWQALLPFSERPLCTAVLVPLTPKAPGRARRLQEMQHCSWHSLTAALWRHTWGVSVPAPSLPPPLSLLVLLSTHTALCCSAPQRMSSVTNDDTLRFSGKQEKVLIETLLKELLQSSINFF